MQLTITDNHFLGSLPPDVRSEVEQWRDWLLAVSKPVQKSLERIALLAGVSPKTARRKYDDFRHSGFDLRVLVNKAKVPEVESAITPEFVEWMKALVEKNQRKTSPALRRFKKMWRSGEQIPGMDNSLPRHQLPAGFSDDNIRRKIADKFATTAMRRGLGIALAKYGPQIFTCRSQLWYGSHLMIDDMWHDNFVVFGRNSNAQIIRALELDALDVFAGHLETFGCKPRFRRPDGTFDNLKESFARLVVANVFFHRGYSTRGSWILAEHGTAAISETVARILFDRTGGLKRRNKRVMATKQNLCCVCGKNPVSECGWHPRCEDKACIAIYHICFSGVADGTTAARNSTTEDLELAFNYLMRCHRDQKTLRKAVAREIARRLREAKS